jgi:beta-glucosidase/6-phospho-beta-glucosidase/beta-galactosidase
MFGVASSASQIEGATAQEGKSPTLMDILIRDDRPKDYTTNENYYLYKQDIERVAAMGAKYYSFSLAWARILPFALAGTPVNQQGLDHYDDVINFILEKGMIPTVTLLHFDTPLQFYGPNLSKAADRPPIGYVNGAYQNETFVDAFVHYAKVAMTHYSDRVPVWYTFNEPLLYSYDGVSIDHVIKAHAQVYHFYKDEMKGTGKVSFKMNDNFGVPKDPSSSADVYMANHFNSFQLATFGNPIFLGIDYPDSYKQTISNYVPLSAEDLAYIGHTADFLGIDPYTATTVTPPVPDSIDSILECAANTSDPFRPYCANQTTTNVYGWNIGYRSQSYVYITPTFLREYLSYLYNTFKVPVVIGEFGKQNSSLRSRIDVAC